VAFEAPPIYPYANHLGGVLFPVPDRPDSVSVDPHRPSVSISIDKSHRSYAPSGTEYDQIARFFLMSRRSRFRHCGKVQLAIQRAIRAAGPIVTTSIVMEWAYGPRRLREATTRDREHMSRAASPVLKYGSRQ